MDEEVERFRNRIRLQENSSVTRTTRPAFATDAKPTFRGEDQQGKKRGKIPHCIYGQKMYFADCPYLVPSKAPTGWKEDPNVRKTVDDALKDSKVQAQVKKNIDARERIAKAASISVNNATPTTPVALPAASYSAVTANASGMESYLIHDGGSNAHVRNSKSAHLYTKTREANSDEYLGSGTGVVKIESWGGGGIWRLLLSLPNGLIPILLENVAFRKLFCNQSCIPVDPR